ncbi:DNA/RNA polymerase [Lepidopterella palustris CBS 459.81]|uniref:DNA/RNA polymerase n=1 Tax=Lepidopterella palustris CBS 459.81 TaxID=1314670 RepID=A0A8E2JHZ8_9PEZI|nr:DNA/RNA polymerase [Lepidopterella palustris CBS 459.81]
MEASRRSRALKRQHESIVIHFDYDCFYASVFEAETPALRSLPLAVQQKQIIVTCNYEARRRGLRKLQLIREAKTICPDVVIVLGEDLTRFRNASKELYAFLRGFSWNAKVERLGFDEVFMDVTDIVDYNLSLLNPNDLTNSFFCLSKDDPTDGFTFDASKVAGYTYPESSNDKLFVGALEIDALQLRLHLGSHLAMHVRHQLEQQKGYTCTVGISTSKLHAKLVGNLHKPKGQTTLLPPYNSDDGSDNVTTLVDGHEIGKIPGIGFKIAQKLRDYALQKPPELNAGLMHDDTKEKVLVKRVRMYPGMSAETLEKVLGGPGTLRGIGFKIWMLINGVDESEVGQARELPKQISIEDSYVRLDTLDEVLKELRSLAKSLINRMHVDLLEDDSDDDPPGESDTGILQTKRWLAHPKTLRLSTRPRPPLNADGSRNRAFNRISRSLPMPNFLFNLNDSVDALAERLVSEALIPLFRKLHPEKNGWNLSLINVAVTNMADAASDSKDGTGRDISKMFKRQDGVLKQWRVEDRDCPPEVHSHDEAANAVRPGNETEPSPTAMHTLSEDILPQSWDSHVDDDGSGWDSDGETIDEGSSFICDVCEAVMPTFAMLAHSRWHSGEQNP